jgi:hypothetical protein
MDLSCHRCGNPAGGAGSVTIKILDDERSLQLAQVALCPACARELGLWLGPVVPPADLPETTADDDDQGDDDSAD